MFQVSEDETQQKLYSSWQVIHRKVETDETYLFRFSMYVWSMNINIWYIHYMYTYLGKFNHADMVQDLSKLVLETKMMEDRAAWKIWSRWGKRQRYSPRSGASILKETMSNKRRIRVLEAIQKFKQVKVASLDSWWGWSADISQLIRWSTKGWGVFIQ
jgi:hypothetical protein